MNKTIRIGTVNGCANFPVDLFCKIEVKSGRLSISGVEGPRSNGNTYGSCGQIVMSDWDIAEYAPGWNAEKVAKFRSIWNDHHLNDMKAGSPAQTQWLKDHPVTDRPNYFNTASEALREAGLNPDPLFLHNGKPYKYGSAWLSVEVPVEAIEFLESLPDSDKTPAWV